MTISDQVVQTLQDWPAGVWKDLEMRVTKVQEHQKQKLTYNFVGIGKDQNVTRNAENRAEVHEVLIKNKDSISWSRVYACSTQEKNACIFPHALSFMRS